MGFDKLTAPLAGQPLVTWSLAAFEACGDIGDCVLVCSASRMEEFTEIAAPYRKVVAVVPGGAERSDSVMQGLRALEANSAGLVAVHDAARPLVSPAMISRVVAAAMEWGAAVAAEPVTDSLHRAAGADHLVETVSRTNLWAMQTPQVAGVAVLQRALESAASSGEKVTDEIAALIKSGLRPRAIFQGVLNFKVTFPRDLALAEAVIASRKSGLPGSL